DHGLEFARLMELCHPATRTHVLANRIGFFLTEPRLHLRNHAFALPLGTVSIPVFPPWGQDWTGPRCCSGPRSEQGVKLAVSPIDDEAGSRGWVGPRHLRRKTAVETLCRNRRLFGTLERLRCGGRGKIVKEAKVASEPEVSC